ncbi:hypothetical protein OHA72_48090 [Dactylosporangium sp. NBC_01737]|uniref:ATP-binding protein n=1 Tax=Dactylosporangium sp. NBC_01737 TaxID=2975959 RepID=UPI002E155375|nr:hypothetical protein OHA72_48090 [Dactylosporangium sp. NBC_01737]
MGGRRWWVDLGAVAEPSLVAPLAAASVRAPVQPAAGALAALCSQLQHRDMLLCLDTCEQVLDAAAELAAALLRACPQVSILATSREPLGVPGELVWRVPSLGQWDAVRLFTERAALVRRDVGPLHDAADAVDAICRRLDGIPLAIELAAAWMRALTPAELAAGLDDRFRLLAGGPRGGVARHQTLLASMDWSYALLEPDEQRVFRRLGLFAGGFTLDAALAVCTGDGEQGTACTMLNAIGRLVDKSLVLPGEQGGRFGAHPRGGPGVRRGRRRPVHRRLRAADAGVLADQPGPSRRRRPARAAAGRRCTAAR